MSALALPLALQWTAIDTWTVIVGVMCAVSCALLGVFLVLRKMSMMGDAISHAVLPGLALAFLLQGSRDSSVMLQGAAVVGLLTAVCTQWIHSAARVDQNAAMGVVFTVLFAIGLILIRLVDQIDLDPDCVLYGAIEVVALDMTEFLGLRVPSAALPLGAVLLLCIAFVTLFFKELKITTFDPALATTLGIHAPLMHYALMVMVALTAVAAFESVGSILVIAMLIVPAATAQLLTDRLGAMLLVSSLAAAASAVLGHLAAVSTPHWFGFEHSTSTAGMIGVVSGVLFLLAMLLAPRHGLLSGALRRARLSLRIAREDLLGALYRIDESGGATGGVPPRLAGVAGISRWTTGLARRALLQRGLIELIDGRPRLTAAGRAQAAQLVRSHRLWEAYFDQHVELPRDHLHRAAGELEHITDRKLQAHLAESLDDPRRDPHGSRIPPA